MVIHLRIPSRVLFLTPAIRAVSSTMQLKTLRVGCSGGADGAGCADCAGARRRAPSALGRRGSAFRRIAGSYGGGVKSSERGRGRFRSIGWANSGYTVTAVTGSAAGLLGARTSICLRRRAQGAGIARVRDCRRGRARVVVEGMARLARGMFRGG